MHAIDAWCQLLLLMLLLLYVLYVMHVLCVLYVLRALNVLHVLYVRDCLQYEYECMCLYQCCSSLLRQYSACQC